MSRPSAVFRCQASATIGGGHVVRSVALASALATDGWQVNFSVTEETLVIVPILATSAFSVDTQVAAGGGEVAALKALWPSGCDLLVADDYRWGAAEGAMADGWAKTRLVIDDLANRRHGAEFLLDQTLGRRVDDYRNLVGQSCRVLAGPTYAVLRAPFAVARTARALSPRAAREIEHVFVSVGLADPANVTGTILEGLVAAGYRRRVTVVIAAGAAHRCVVDDFSRQHFDVAAVLSGLSGDDMARHLGDADVAIGAAGVSSYERACLGVPTLLVELAENQRDNIAALVGAGAAISLGRADNLRAAAVAATFRDLVGAPERRAAMSRAAGLISDGRGAERVALALRPELARDGEHVGLRPVTAGDAELMLAWQSQPEARRHARNPLVPI